MSYKHEREEFIAQTAGKLRLSLIHAVLRRANTLQRNAVLSCSSILADRDRVPCPGVKHPEHCCCDQPDHGHEMVPRIDRQDARIRRELDVLLDGTAYRADYQGDPRGYVLKLVQREDNREFGVPSRGLPASFWEAHERRERAYYAAGGN